MYGEVPWWHVCLGVLCPCEAAGSSSQQLVPVASAVLLAQRHTERGVRTGDMFI